MTFFLFWSSTVRCSCHLHACSSSACPLIHCNGSSFARRQGISRAECKRTRKAVASRAAEPSSAAETSAFSWEVGHFRSEINPHVFVLEVCSAPTCGFILPLILTDVRPTKSAVAVCRESTAGLLRW